MSECTRRGDLKSVLSPIKLGNRDVELLNEPDRDLRLGPLNVNTPVDTNSRLGMEP